ncbi:acyltransferase family protein [Asticcacaulis excentricus]|uniref:Acyltransferase, putative n=1 Tax=Asticcacaulis excentricus TaxID=78587 RepID=A0A3G9G3P0_9CAUL|nr:acyltransferase [Asticcacaulis excentricus]BBF79574.1 acyltransferase, putative [Asticcacaulis excentricus]
MSVSVSPLAPHPRAGGASLDVLRFLAAGFILLFHFGESAPRPLGDLIPVLWQGWLATDFFLMLSGFILMRAYGPRLAEQRVSPLSFVSRRILRLWPSHIVALLLLLAVVTLATLQGHPPGHAEKYTVSGFFEQLMLVHGWGISQIPGWNVPTWTLSALVVCYSLFSLSAGRVYRWNRAALVVGIVAILGLGLALGALIGHAFVDLPFQYGLIRALPLFFIGALLERLTAGVGVSQRAYFAGMAISGFIVIVLGSLPRDSASDVVILAALATVLVLSAGVRFHESHLTKRLGRASYALFLIHTVIGAIALGVDGMLMHRFALSEPVHWIVWGLCVAAAIAAAFVFEACVDRPLSQWVTARLIAPRKDPD